MILKIEGAPDVNIGGGLSQGDILLLTTVIVVREVIDDTAYGGIVANHVSGVKTSELFNKDEPQDYSGG